MNSMSASDAAPLPRLGEVFFDVRGSSRSMRLSWYSDTGVAVFSIWQGGTCTGTFRLPIEDLSRMTEALQRGPRGAGQPVTDVPSLTGLPGGRRGQSGGTSGDISMAPFAEYATGQHIAPVTGEFRRPELEERATDPFGPGGYQAPSPDPVYRPSAPTSPSAPYSPAPFSSAPRFSPASPNYREDPLTSPSFRDEARSGSYRQQSAASPISPAPVPPAPAPPAPSFSPAPTYREDPLTSPSFRDEARSAGYRDSSAPYGDDPLGSGSYRSASYRDQDRPDQSYQDQAYPDRGYPGDDAGYAPGYRDDDTGGYQDRRYADDPFQSNYPDEPHGGSHPYGQPGPEPRGHRGRPSRT
jgi:hypothetical protein